MTVNTAAFLIRHAAWRIRIKWKLHFFLLILLDHDQL